MKNSTYFKDASTVSIQKEVIIIVQVTKTQSTYILVLSYINTFMDMMRSTMIYYWQQRVWQWYKNIQMMEWKQGVL